MRLNRNTQRKFLRALVEAVEQRQLFAAPSGVLLNEIDVNPPSTDTPYEFVEIRGVANPSFPSLSNVYFASVDGDSGSMGTAKMVVDLSAASFGSNGLLIIKSSTGGFTPAAGTAIVTDTQLDSGVGGIENGSNSFLVIYSPTTPITETTDYDTDDDGTLEALPADAVILDAVAWADLATDKTYVGVGGTPAILTQVSGIAEAATRFPTDDTANELNAWYSGQFAGSAATSTAYTTSANNRSANFPSGGALTPGELNAPSGVITYTMAFSASNYNTTEGAGSVTITVTRSTFGAETSIDYATSNGTAVEPGDYTATSGTLNFGVNDSSLTFTVPIIDDTDSEGNEAINLTLSNPTGTNAVLGTPSTATITIPANDAAGPPAVIFNEISADVPGTDEPYEFVEVKGTGSLADVYFVDLQGDSGGTLGQASTVINLSTGAFGSNGLLLLKAPTTGHTPQDLNTGILTASKFAASGGALGSNSESFLLIYSPNSAIAPGAAIGDATGALSGLPAGAVVLDSVGWSDGGASDKVFATANLSFPSPSGTNLPGVATRVVGDNTANNAASWYYGKVTATTSLTYATAAASTSTNLPAGAVLTPGAANYTASSDTVPPEVTSKVFDFDTSGVAPSLIVTFSEPVQNITLSDLATSSFTITDRSTNTPIAATNFTLTPLSTSVYQIKFVGANNAPSDGDFKLTINAANVKDLANNALAADESLNYSFLQGDASGDRKVNTLDFNILAGNFGPTGKKFSQGDFSFDGNIDSVDFGILLTQYAKSLPAVPPPAPLLSVGAGIFGLNRIDDTDTADSLLA